MLHRQYSKQSQIKIFCRSGTQAKAAAFRNVAVLRNRAAHVCACGPSLREELPPEGATECTLWPLATARGLFFMSLNCGATEIKEKGHSSEGPKSIEETP